MMKVTVRDLRCRTKRVLEAVERGEVVTVLYRGKEKARLTPLPAGARCANAIPGQAFGMWKGGRISKTSRVTSASCARAASSDL